MPPPLDAGDAARPPEPGELPRAAALERFELFVALRYLRARRKQAVISVITWISVLGVAAGVMALIIALAVTNGFRGTLQRSLLGATAHVRIIEKEPGDGIRDWAGLMPRLRSLPHVTAATPSLYGYVLFSGPMQSQGGVLKGIRLDDETRRELAAQLRQGSLERLSGDSPMPGLILGSKLAAATGMLLDSVVQVISPQGETTPLGPRPSYTRFRVVGIFETGFYDLDLNWAFTSLESAQRALSLGDVVNAIEMKVDDIYSAPGVASSIQGMVGPRLAATHWMELNRPLLDALRLDRVVTVIIIGLIQLVGGLNILITLVMMTMEKTKDIALLMSMGATRRQIRTIFVAQGAFIGAAGTLVGLIAGYTLSGLAGRYRWITLDESIYALSFVPFEPRWTDGLWVGAAAMLISVLATIYPARRASEVAPAEAIRFE